jgi:hypothetical protein
MVLGVHCEAIALRVLGDASRERPRNEDAIPLEAKVPVQPPCVMLLYYEAGGALLDAALVTGRFRRLLEGSFRAVLLELLRRG